MWLDYLSPYFFVDPTLPYTYMALLSKEALANLLMDGPNQRTCLIPLDAILACLRFHIKAETMYLDVSNDLSS